MTPNSVKPLDLYINNVNEFIEASNANKYLKLVPADESKDKLNKYIETWNKIKNLIRSTNINSDYYNEKFPKIKSHTDQDLPLKNTRIIWIIVVERSAFFDGNKYYPRVF